MKLPNPEFRDLVKFVKEGREDNAKKIYIDKEPRKIDWNSYTLSQISEAKDTLLFIKQEVDKCYLPTAKVGRPLTNPRALAKAVLACEALGFTERKAQGWLEILGQFMGMHEKLDDRVIGNAYNKMEVAFILKQVFDNNKNSNGELAGDGTGLETSRKQNYGADKQSTKDFMTSIVDSREIVLAFDFSGKEECQAMHTLIKEVEGKSLRLDAGFNDRELVRKIAEQGMLPYIYPKSNNNLNGSNSWKQMYLEFLLDVIAWLEEYYQRTHCESFHSSIKRVFGIIRKVRSHCKFVQLISRIILHNRARLSYFNKLKE